MPDINGDVQSILPANFDPVMPDPAGSNWALSELYLVQLLPKDFFFVGGKFDFAAWADGNLFANSEKHQFVHAGLVNNPIAGAFFPYTTFGAFLSWFTPSKEHNLTLVWADNSSSESATKASADTWFDEDNSFAFQWIYASSRPFGMPTLFVFDAAYSTRDITSFAFDDQISIADIVDEVPPQQESDNYAVEFSLSQYLWAKEGSAEARHPLPPVGIGFFARGGWSPKDRNAIDQFYSFGIAGYGMIPGRDDDQWGVGWAGTHFSSDLRSATELAPLGLRDWEHAIASCRSCTSPSTTCPTPGRSASTRSSRMTTRRPRATSGTCRSVSS